jgi:FkbM family methyltransferase
MLKQRTLIAIARHRQAAVLRFADRAALAYHRCHSNVNYNMSTNGEARILRCLATSEPVRVFDVGANVGEWTRAARLWMPTAELHCFEIVPRTAGVLRRNMTGLDNVVLNEFGLGSTEGDVPVHIVRGDSSRSSIVHLPGTCHPDQTITCRIMRGDEYCRRRGITQIRLLKIDTEGADYNVLQGFERMLSSRSIDVLQFEYGLWSIFTKHLLVDYYQLLSDRDYRVGKVFPHYVDFRPYNPRMDEDFLGPNYVAVRTDEDELTTLLAGFKSGSRR